MQAGSEPSTFRISTSVSAALLYASSGLPLSTLRSGGRAFWRSLANDGNGQAVA